MDEIAQPGQVNVRLASEAISQNLAGILRGYGHDEAAIDALLAVRGDAMTSAAELGTNDIIDASLDARFGDYARVLGDGVPQMEEI